MFAQIDQDNSGLIEYSEFVMATINEKNMLSNEKLQQAFNMFDQDGSGSINADEIRQALSFKTLSEQQVKAIIKEADDNGDGEIQFDEFV